MRKLVASRRLAAVTKSETAQQSEDLAVASDGSGASDALGALDAGWDDESEAELAPVHAAPVHAAPVHADLESQFKAAARAPVVDDDEDDDGTDAGWDEFLSPEEEAEVRAGTRIRRRPPSKERRDEKKRRKKSEKSERAEARASKARAEVEDQRRRGLEQRRANRQRSADLGDEDDSEHANSVAEAAAGAAELDAAEPTPVPRKVPARTAKKPEPRRSKVERAASKDLTPVVEARRMPWALLAFITLLTVAGYFLFR